MKVSARYFDPQAGSFITRDTYLDQKPYLYSEHDPVNAGDPSRHLYIYVGVEVLFIGLTVSIAG